MQNYKPLSPNRSDRPVAHLVRWTCVALAILGSSCASTRSVRTAALSDDAVILDLPFVEQNEMYACGLVSVSALCRYWGVDLPTTEQTRLSQLAQERAGLSGSELRDTLEGLGFEAFLFTGTLDRQATGLLGAVDAGRPPLVMISPATNKFHYVLFLGYDEPEKNVCLLDPVRGRVIVPFETFDRSWRACDRFTLLAIPAESAQSSRPSAPEKRDRP